MAALVGRRVRLFVAARTVAVNRVVADISIYHPAKIYLEIYD